MSHCSRISRWVRWRPSWRAEWNDHCNSESKCGLYAYHKVFNVTYGSGVDVIFTSSGWLSWRSDILQIRTTCAILSEGSMIKISLKLLKI